MVVAVMVEVARFQHPAAGKEAAAERMRSVSVRVWGVKKERSRGARGRESSRCRGSAALCQSALRSAAIAWSREEEEGGGREGGGGGERFLFPQDPHSVLHSCKVQVETS